MKTLYSIYKHCAKQSTKVIDALIPNEKKSPLKELFVIIKSDNELDDKAAMERIYGRKNVAAFSRLKTRLRDIMVKSLSMQNINLESLDSRVNEAHAQFRNVLVAKILKDLKANDLSIELAEKSIIKAMRYHTTEIVIILARMLVQHYGSAEYNKYKLNKYLEIQNKYLRQHEWEIKSENYYFDLQRIQLQSLASPSLNTISKAAHYVKELEAVDGIRSLNFNLNCYKVKAAFYEYNKNYEALLDLSNQALVEFSSPDLKSGTILQNINIRKAWALIQAGRNNETISIGTKEMSRLPSGSLGWFFIAHYTLKAHLYRSDYNKAIELITIIINNPKFNKLGVNYRELFYTTLGYIYLVIDSGIDDQLAKHRYRLPEFKLYKFLNTIPVFSKDKRGINVSILLMHVAFLLQRKDYNAIIDRVDSLNQYAYRYLRKDDSFRSNCMIKMVIQMTKADFNPIRTARYTQDLLNQLEQVKLAGSGENIETEIIPYEVLWNIMVRSL